MQFDYRYLGNTAVDSTSRDTSMSFVPDASRPATFFHGLLHKKLPFREAISTLHGVVVSDLRYTPKDRSEYMEWLQTQELADLNTLAAKNKATKERIQALSNELQALRQSSRKRMADFYRAQRQYFDYLYRTDYDAWFVLDPVITVHPDEIFFECFSQDESTYGRLSCGYDVFKSINDFSCGTTNIDYSYTLYNEFQKIRTYKETTFQVDPSGFEVQTTAEDAYREVKIDLPESWVRGFLQVSSAMTLPSHSFQLHPMDVLNVCAFLRRFREKQGPRSIRYHLNPGQPIQIELDPWGHIISCPRSVYTGSSHEVIRVWGRRRLHILERLVPISKSITVHLLGRGLPSFYVADLGDMSFTLGLSGWTKNDWASASNFDLLAPRSNVDSFTARRVFQALKSHWLATPQQLASQLNLDTATVLSSLSLYTQAGRVIYDLNKHTFRARELSRDPLPIDSLRFSNEREQHAHSLLQQNAVSIDSVQHHNDGSVSIEASVQGKSPKLHINHDARITDASCTCSLFYNQRLTQGPCEHILAARLAFDRKDQQNQEEVA